MSQFEPIPYADLNSRQKENYNFHKIAARLANFGFNCLRLTDDWQGADFIACHIDGETFLKVQLKGRLVIDRKYQGKDIHIAFIHGDGASQLADVGGQVLDGDGDGRPGGDFTLRFASAAGDPP